MNKLSLRPQNKTFSQRTKTHIKRQQQNAALRKAQYDLNPRKCLLSTCTNNLPYRYVGKFCSKSCSASHNNGQRGPMTRETREKISDTLSSKLRTHSGSLRSNKVPPKTTIQYSNCEICNSSFYVKHAKNIRNNRCGDCKTLPFSLVVTSSCATCGITILHKRPRKYCTTCAPNLALYRTRCQFRFNVYEYPDLFNLALVEQHGWYSPNGYKRRNKQPNLSGVSRDHMYSVRDGYYHNIDPDLLSHPANCRLMLHNGDGGNNAKNYQSCITLEQLKQRIDSWPG